MFAIVKNSASRGIWSTATQKAAPLGPNDVRIKVSHAGICGTDLHIFQWDKWAEGRVKIPTVLGHEFVGTISELGSHVTHVSLGQRVSAECHVVCGTCRFCRTGRGHLCPDTRIIGVDRDGAFCEEVVVPASNLWPIHPDIPNHHAAIFDPLGNAMHTVSAFDVAGKVVLVSGTGSIGLMAVAMAKALGAATVVVSEPQAHKRELAKTLGADLCLDPAADDLAGRIRAFTGGDDVQVVLEMSGHPRALTTALELVTPGGEVALLGLPSAAVTLPLAETVIFKGLTLQGIIGRRMYDTWYAVDTFVRKHPDVVEKIVSHVLPAADFAKGFDLLESGKSAKIVLDFTTV